MSKSTAPASSSIGAEWKRVNRRVKAMRQRNAERMNKQSQLERVLASQRASAIRYIELSLQVRRAIVARLLATRTLNAECSIASQPDDVEPQTVVIHRLEEVLAVLRRAP